MVYAPAGFFQLINLWVIYVSYATLNFCCCLIYFIMCTLEMMFFFAEFRRVTNPNSPYNQSSSSGTPGYNDNSGSSSDQNTVDIHPLLYIGYGYIFIYNVFAMFYSYRSFKHFKELFQQQNQGGYMGFNDDGYNPYGNGGGHDEERY